MIEETDGHPVVVQATPTAKATAKTTLKPVKPTGTSTAKPVKTKTKHHSSDSEHLVDGLLVLFAIALFVLLLIHFSKRRT